MTFSVCQITIGTLKCFVKYPLAEQHKRQSSSMSEKDKFASKNKLRVTCVVLLF